MRRESRKRCDVSKVNVEAYQFCRSPFTKFAMAVRSHITHDMALLFFEKSDFYLMSWLIDQIAPEKL